MLHRYIRIGKQLATKRSCWHNSRSLLRVVSSTRLSLKSGTHQDQDSGQFLLSQFSARKTAATQGCASVWLSWRLHDCGYPHGDGEAMADRSCQWFSMKFANPACFVKSPRWRISADLCFELAAWRSNKYPTTNFLQQQIVFLDVSWDVVLLSDPFLRLQEMYFDASLGINLWWGTFYDSRSCIVALFCVMDTFYDSRSCFVQHCSAFGYVLQ